MLKQLVAEVRAKFSHGRVTVAAVARHINQTVRQAVEAEDYSHPVFDIGPARGGPHAGGGIFWADFDAEHREPVRHPRLWQVFGHSPPVNSHDKPFRVTSDRQRINVDIGICEHYGGNLGFLELERNEVVGVLIGKKLKRQTLAKAKEKEEYAASVEEVVIE